MQIFIIIGILLLLFYLMTPDMFSKTFNFEKFEQQNNTVDVNNDNMQNVPNVSNMSKIEFNNVADDGMNIPIKIGNAEFGNNYFLDDGNNGNMVLTSSLCSKSCCSPQYPTPFSLPVDPMVCNSDKKFIPTNYTCNNGWQDTGCLCMTIDQAKFLGARGGNT